MNTNDGGPAFPHDGQQNYTGGMTLRDYFAAKAMQAILHTSMRAADEVRLSLINHDGYSSGISVVKRGRRG